MIDMENNASARLPATGVWLARGEALARAAAGPVRGFRGWLRRAFAGLASFRARSAAQRELYRLDDRLLADIGLRREQVPEFVDGMLRRGPVEEATRPTGTPSMESVEPVSDADTGNDGTYRSAA